MGRKKLEIKRIEDKHNRSVTFSKRRAGLMKKARHLSLLCDADVALIAFSAGGRLYEFSSGSSTANSVEHILSRYQQSSNKVGDITTKGAGEDLEPLSQGERFQTCKDLLQAVNRFAGENNVEELSMNDMTELEQELDATLVQARLRKTQLMMEYLSTLQDKEKKLAEEKQQLEKGVASAISCRLVGKVRASREENENEKEDGEGLNNNLATNQMNSPQQLVTLPLFFND